MATKIRPVLSEKNKYYIDKHRYYELKHFCLQYDDWKKAYSILDGYDSYQVGLGVKSSGVSDRTADYGMAFAAAILSMIPVVLCFMFMQKYIVNGITVGAVKS